MELNSYVTQQLILTLRKLDKPIDYNNHDKSRVLSEFK